MTAAPQRVVEFQGRLGLVIPVGSFSGVSWTRSAATATQVGGFMPLNPGQPIPLGKGAEIYLRQNSAGGVGTVTLVYVEITMDELNDAVTVQAIALAIAGRTGGPSAPSLAVTTVPEYTKTLRMLRVTQDGSAHAGVITAGSVYQLVRNNGPLASMFISTTTGAVAVAGTRFEIPVGGSFMIPVQNAGYAYIGTNTDTYDSVDLGN